MLDLREYKRDLSLYDLKKIISAFGSASARELLICGNFTFDYVPVLSIETLRISDNQKTVVTKAKKQNIKSLDVEFFDGFLLKHCPNLRLLALEYLDLTEVEFVYFSQLKKLQTFSLRWCSIESNWFNLGINETPVSPSKSLTKWTFWIIIKSHLFLRYLLAELRVSIDWSKHFRQP